MHNDEKDFQLNDSLLLIIKKPLTLNKQPCFFVDDDDVNDVVMSVSFRYILLLTKKALFLVYFSSILSSSFSRKCENVKM
jgi:hypothetical protein